MTIAAGFRCTDGVVLCADTQISREGLGKSYEAKILPIEAALDCYLVYAGTVGFAKEFVQTVRKKISGKWGQEIAEEIKRSYIDFHRRHYTNLPAKDKTWAQIIFSVREDDNKVALYEGQDYHCLQVERYASLGVGASLAEPFFSSYYSEHLTVEDATNLAVYTLQQIKDLALGCGGSTNVLAIKDKYVIGDPTNCLLSDEQIQEKEVDCSVFHSLAKRAFFSFLRCDSSTAEEFSDSFRYLNIELKHFTSELRGHQKEKRSRRKREEKQENRENEIAILRAEDQPDEDL